MTTDVPKIIIEFEKKDCDHTVFTPKDKPNANYDIYRQKGYVHGCSRYPIEHDFRVAPDIAEVAGYEAGKYYFDFSNGLLVRQYKIEFTKFMPLLPVKNG